MSKHTPGPWTVDDWQYSVPGRGHVPTIVNGQDAVAEAMGLWRDGADDTEEREANARLIAAAPELLEALQALIDWEAQPGQRVPLGIAGIIDSLVRPAIAKAEGRE